MHWPSLFQLSDRFEVTALCDVSPVILEQLGKFWNVPPNTRPRKPGRQILFMTLSYLPKWRG